MQNDYTKRPRLYTPERLARESPLVLSEAQGHYLRAVLRLQEGANIRLFNGLDGEWAARLDEVSKKACRAAPTDQLRPQSAPAHPVHLMFAPIKKNRMDILIEKSVELGVTDLHPVLTSRTDSRAYNQERVMAQIIEAAEQCERLTLPRLHSPLPLLQALKTGTDTGPILWARERGQAQPLASITGVLSAFLIGPEGGFDPHEIAALESHTRIMAISLGPQILRSETAALAALSYALLKNAESG